VGAIDEAVEVGEDARWKLAVFWRWSRTRKERLAD
jgi:hypothetical protein